MPQIGPLEILVVAVVALIVFGPEKLPDLARKVGRTATELRRIANEAKAEFQTDFSLDDDDEYAQSSSASRTSRRRDGARRAPDDSDPEASPAPSSAEKAGSDDAGAADEGDGDSDAARNAG